MTTIGAKLSRLGPSSNAETHADYTDYWIIGPPDALEEIAEVEVDRLARG